jgi:hypothetical protein
MVRAAPLATTAVGRLRGEVEAQSAAVQRMRADVRAIGALGDSAALARQQLVALAPVILTGASEAEAVSDLAARLSALAAGHHAVMQRHQPVPDTTRVGRLARITLRAVFESDLPGALATLATVDGDRAVLTLRSVRLSESDPGSPDASPEVLSAEATVSGW